MPKNLSNEDPMQHKWMTFVTVLLCGLIIATAGPVQAQAQTNVHNLSPNCPGFQPNLLKDKDFLYSLPSECIQAYKQADQQANPGREQNLQQIVSSADGFGYSFNDSIAYNWISAATNSGLIGDNEFTGPIDIGFNFPFYGIPQSQLYFSTNGLITFGAGNSNEHRAGFPVEAAPNNLIAAFWDDLMVGSPSNGGAISYSRGGSAPNRYFVVEWRNVEEVHSCSSPIFTFEAILYENGDVVVQYQSLPDCHYASVGIEDSLGSDGLGYSNNLAPLKAIRFYYPTIPSARLSVSPLLCDGAFAPLNGYKDFLITVTNPGTLGADTYDLTNFSGWPVDFYASNGVTPLIDTDHDSQVDTGPLPQSTTTTVIARVSTPGGAQIGDQNTAAITITSSLNVSKTKTVSLFTSIPANFTSAFRDSADGAMSFMAADHNEVNISKVTSDNYFGQDTAITKLDGNNYIYAWDKNYFNGSYWHNDIEFTVLNSNGSMLLPIMKLTDNASEAMQVIDRYPSVAMAPNGTIGIVWLRHLYDFSTSKVNDNVYFATLNKSGDLLAGPVNITNNTIWSGKDDMSFPGLECLSIAASDDNRFVFGWTDIRFGSTGYIWYTIRDTTGANLLSPLAVTEDNISMKPRLNSLTGGKVILTWEMIGATTQYLIIHSDGTPGQRGEIDTHAFDTPDVVQLPNGKVAIAWPTYTGIGFAILNSSYVPENIVMANTPNLALGDALSLTTDASSHIIMTWASDMSPGVSSHKYLFYALGDSTGAFITPPVLYKKSTSFIDNGYNGQGNAPYEFGGSTINVKIGNSDISSYWLVPQESQRKSYPDINSGPVQIFNKLNHSILGAERVIYKVGGVNTSFTEMMGLPDSQLDKVYWLPWYNNVDLDTQLRFGNVSGSPATVHIYIGTDEMQGSPFTLEAGESTRVSFAGINNGPVKIQSNVNIVVAERVIYRVNGINTSFTEMMALPNSQLNTTYWLPWYNNVDLDTQLRFGNVSSNIAHVHVYIGTDEMTGSPFTLQPGESTRKSFTGINNGPVKIQSDQNIVAAERVIYKVNGTQTSFTETMALPNSQLNTTYWLPWYNNADLDTQLRFGNVSNNTATVHVYVGGVEMSGSPFTLGVGESKRISFASINNGPVKIVSDQNIVAAERVIYKVNNIQTSFSEMMALPNNQLDSIYWLPWYNNVDLDTQLRFGVP